MNFSNPTDPAQLCTTCRAEVSNAARSGSYTLTSNITDRDDRERVIREAQAAGTDGNICARCALRPVAVSA
jgi:hypothetical protein